MRRLLLSESESRRATGGVGWRGWAILEGDKSVASRRDIGQATAGWGDGDFTATRKRRRVKVGEGRDDVGRSTLASSL